jgi:hypothetical protein
MRQYVERAARVRLDHALLVAGPILMTIGSSMPWITGSTRNRGNIDWTGFNDTGEGAMLMLCGLVAVMFVRWRGILEGTDSPARWIGLGAGVAALALWGVAFQKILSLSWWELEVGARPQLGIYLALLGAVLTVVGGALAGRRRANPDVVEQARRRAARRRPKSGFDRDLQVGADGYAARGKVTPGRNEER